MLEVEILPAWEDNYIFIIHNNKEAYIVDPTCADTCINFIENRKLKPIAILNTHHHPDHIGGNPKLIEKYGLEAYCSEYDKDRVPGAKHLLKENDELNILGHKTRILDLKGHTLGLIGYYIEDHDFLFSGDCIFSLGCGYVFEGSYKQAFEALKKIKSLPEQTKIFCSHEYTLANAKFQASFEKSSAFLQELKKIENKRNNDIKTIPTELSYEKKWNSFLRWDDPALKKNLGFEKLEEEKYFEALRIKKNKH
jgi:hydroxyacylglutathione hydrolase